MMTRRRGKKSPLKLTAFFPAAEASQDGAAQCGSASPATGSASPASSSSPTGCALEASPSTPPILLTGWSPSVQQDPQVPFSPISSKPLGAGTLHTRGPGGPDGSSPSAPLTEPIMRGLLAELHTSIQGDIKAAVSNIQHEISSLGHRTSHIENKMAELTSSHNEVVDLANGLEDEVAALQLKIADMEDRSRRNNLRASTLDLLMDRVHRLPKPKTLPATTPRDVILRLHFYHIKEQLMLVARSSPSLPEEYSGLQLFTDLSAATLARRREFSAGTKALREKGIPYKWGFPVKLIITNKGSKHVVSSPETLLQLCAEWNLPVDLTAQRSLDIPHAAKIAEEWKVVSHRKKKIKT
ncbi:uncharacterized protein LOC130357419 [Hyla sarda]|uniref:uncharacterized protein LOC130293615 n=1 Tax=Hyla sarda TaxID=327740 RepID=UPI0024C3732E|nr:uncharacterized protein LOC130293615 [Hyla sarda]XP_056416087.1 uncharacterized protein LOC130357419 [Hyla sarda]